MSSLNTPADEFQEGGVQRTLSGNPLRFVLGCALAFSAFQLMVAGFHPLSSLVIRSLHVGFLLLLTFLMYPAFKTGKLTSIAWYDGVLALVAFALSFYHWIFEADLIQRSGDPTISDLVVGTVMVVLVFEATRRILGWALPIVCGTFLLYGLFGQYLPGVIAHRGYGFDQIVGQLWLGTEGVLGIPVMV
ncbi:MAG: TRAP transporter permease, partial [Herbaspirillum sp.]